MVINFVVSGLRNDPATHRRLPNQENGANIEPRGLKKSREKVEKLESLRMLI